MSLSNNIINKIKETKLKPIPKVVFTAKNISAWSLYLLAVFIGSLAIGIIEMDIFNTEWSVIESLGPKFWDMLNIIPYVWIVLVTVSITLAVKELKETENGYTYNNFYIVGSNILISLLIGSLFYFSNFSYAVHDGFVNNIPMYDRYNIAPHMRIWNDPKNGRLAGRVTETFEGFFTLEDPNKTIWRVDIESAYDNQIGEVFDGMMVKTIGEDSGENLFIAHHISPLRQMKKNGFGERMKEKLFPPRIEDCEKEKLINN